MATQEITLKFRGDPSLLKGALNELKTAHASTMAEITRQQKAEAAAATALQRQRSSALITVWKADTQAAVSEERRRAQAILQEEKQLAAQMIRESRAAQNIRAQVARSSEQEERRLAATVIREARAAATSRVQAERAASADIKRLERERQQIAAQTSKAITAQAKSEADARIREGRRASAAVIASLRAELREAQLAQRQIATVRGSSFLAGAAGGLSALLGVSAISEIRAAGAAMLNYASTLETTTIAFTTMLGSAEAATQHLRELQAFALKTPFQFEELIAASQRMQALGFNAAQVVPILTDVGNAVAAAGGGSERLDRVVLAISQIQSKGRLATQEINQLAEAGINSYKMLEAQLGKSRAELVKMVEQGQISSAVFLEAFQKFSQQNFGGLMEQQSKTFAGAMSNIKDALLQTSNTAFAPLYKRLSELAQQFAETATKSKDFKESLNDIGKVAATIPDSFIELVRIIKDAVAVVFAAMTQQVVVATHSFFALGRMIQSAVFALQAFVRFSIGDFAGAARAIENSNRQAVLAFDEIRKAAIGGGTVIREFGRIMEDAASRTEAAAIRIRVAAAMMLVQDAATGARVVGGDFGAGAVGAGILRLKAPTVPGGGGGRGSAGADQSVREEQQRLDYYNSLVDVFNKLEAEIDGVKVETRAYAVEQAILNGALKDADVGLQNMARETARLIDIDQKRLGFIKQVKDFYAEQSKAIKELMEGQKGYMGQSEDFIQALEKEGAVLPENIKWWIRFNASILQANTALERAIELEERHRDIQSLPGAAGGLGLSDEAISVAAGARANAVSGTPPFMAGLPEQTDVFREFSRVMGETFTLGTEQAAVFGNILASTFGQVAGAVGEAVRAFVLFGKAEGGFKRFAAEVIASIAQMAATQAIFELAQGLAMLALAYFFPKVEYFKSSAAHFAAAGVFGAVAAGAALSGRAIAGNAFNSSSGGGTGGGSGHGGPDNRNVTPKPVDIDRRISATPQINLRVIVERDEGSTVRAVIDDYRSNGIVRKMILTDGQG